MPKTVKKTKKVAAVKAPVVAAPVESYVETSTTRPTPRYTVALIAILLIAASLGYVYYRFWNIATVNGRPISRLEYYQTMDKQIGKQTLDNLVTEALIADAGAKKGITVPQSEIDKAISDIENQIKSQGQTLDQALTQAGMTRADLEKQTRLQKLVETLSASPSAITQEQITKYISTNKAQLPSTATPQELQDLAKTQLEKQAQNENLQKWLSDIRAQAVITYR